MPVMFTVDMPALSRSQAAMRWRELAAVLPEEARAETDQFGELILAPLPTNRHQLSCRASQKQLEQQLGGWAVTSLAINTRIGVRVPDVCWTAEPSRFTDDPAPSAPEICIEVASPGNSAKGLLDKAAAYLDSGAREAVIVELDSRIRCFDANGERPDSVFGLRLSLPVL